MGWSNRDSGVNDPRLGNNLNQRKRRLAFSSSSWAAICFGLIVFSAVCAGFNVDNGDKHSDREDAWAFSGGKTNLPKRFRPNKGKSNPIEKYSEVNDRARWMIRTIMIAVQEDMYLFGSWMNQNWWIASDLDLCIESEPTETQKRQVELLGKQFDVKIDLRRCSGRGKRIKCEEEY